MDEQQKAKNREYKEKHKEALKIQNHEWYLRYKAAGRCKVKDPEERKKIYDETHPPLSTIAKRTRRIQRMIDNTNKKADLFREKLKNDNIIQSNEDNQQDDKNRESERQFEN